MGDRLFRKGLIAGIIFLFIGMSVIPSTSTLVKKSSTMSYEGKTLYVGGSGPGNYSTIEDAIANSSSGDTIYVYSGVYNETFQPKDWCCVKIPRPLNLIGENKTTTIINGNGRYDTISVTASNVNISGFTIQRGGTPGTGAYGRGLSIQQVSNVIVSDVILSQNYLGIILHWSSNVLLDNLTFIDKGGSISFWDGSNCTINHCIFDNAGISHSGFPPSNSGRSLYIRNNVFINNSGIGLGYLCIDTFGNTTIESNLFENNSCCISTYNCKGVNILRNNFINNTQNAQIAKECYIREIRDYIGFKQNWINNYWDDWNQNGSYSIPGIWTFYIGIGHFTFPIFKIPFREYDYNPAKEPYDIGVCDID